MMTWDLSGSRRLGEPFQAGAGTDALPGPLTPGRTSRSVRTGACWRRTTSTASSILDATTHAVVRTIKATQPGRLVQRDVVTGRHAGWRSRAPGRRSWSSTTRRRGSSSARTAGRSAGPAPIVRRWPDRDRPQQSHRHRRRLNVARAVAFSPDSAELVAGDDDGTVWTWDAQDRRTRRTPAAVRRPVFDLAFNPVSKALAVGYCGREPRGASRSSHRAGRRRCYTVNVDDALRPPGRRRLQPGRDGPRDGRRYGRRPVLGRGDRGGDRSARRHRRPAGSSTSRGPRRARRWSAPGRTGRCG